MTTADTVLHRPTGEDSMPPPDEAALGAPAGVAAKLEELSDGK